jgi:monoamine oxidase
MSRTTLMSRLVEAAAIAVASRARRLSVEQVSEECAARRFDRREFLKVSATAALALAGGFSAPAQLLPAKPTTSPRVVIAGAGLAGLTCAYRLRQAGCQATVYEASSRLGGRCLSMRGFFHDSQLAERGGEVIDTGHKELRTLARELGLELDDLCAAEKPGSQARYFFEGRTYTQREVADDFAPLVPRLRRDLKAAGARTLYSKNTARGRELDRMSVLDWIRQNVPGGVESRFGRLLNVAYTAEYGAECDEQSALNLLYLLGYAEKKAFKIFGPSDERFRIRGGNDLLASRLAGRVEEQVITGHELVAVVRAADGAWHLTFKEGSNTRSVKAEVVVLAIPFSVMRRSVDFRQAGFRDLKQAAIQELGMGTNSKLQLQFRSRLWEPQGCNGETFSDTGNQETWDASRAQPGSAGLMVNFTGGTAGSGMNQGTAEDRALGFLRQMEPVVPGLGAGWNGKVLLDYWTGNPWTRGSYAFWKIGQYTRFAGIEGEREGNCHFCGEHASIDSQGYLNGAVETGMRVAREISRELPRRR